jgi:hypothetical protein
MRERARVDRVRLDPGRRDRLSLPRMRQMQLDPLRLEQIRQPLPPERGLERDPRLTTQLGEDRAQRLRLVRHSTRKQL